MPAILVADHNPEALNQIELSASQAELAVLVAADSEDLVFKANAVEVDIVILDADFDDQGLALYQRLADSDQHLPVIIVADRANSRQAIEATKLGALDFLVKPLDEHELQRVIARALEIRRFAAEPIALNPDSPEDEEGDAMIGQCTAMRDVYKSIGRVASQNVTVLVRGESGTGKELVARAIFQFGNRSEAPFMAINCAAIPDALLESELFGHEKGSFTGADRQRIGKFEQCDNGTLFLDEIGDMSMILQGKLLRVLQEQSFERVGGSQTIKTNVRVLSATHRDLEAMVKSGQFRGDLFYRLNGYTIELPPLRERDGDLIYLLEHFRIVSNLELGKSVSRFSPESIGRLSEYDWPGNIRELQSVIRKAILQTSGKVVIPDFMPKLGLALKHDGVQVNDLSDESVATLKSEIQNLIQQKIQSGENNVYDSVIERVERELLTQVLIVTEGNQVEAASILGITRTTLRTKIKKLGIQISRSVATQAEDNPDRKSHDATG
ncbi:MAG: DNA-binding NtrC family response regulator [Mariniblastus sp.]|jgi:DNA-binding NtrC family response regulator